MGIAYSCDKDSGVSYEVWAGVVTGNDWVEHVRRQVADPGWPAGDRSLTDLRARIQQLFYRQGRDGGGGRPLPGTAREAGTRQSGCRGRQGLPVVAALSHLHLQAWVQIDRFQRHGPGLQVARPGLQRSGTFHRPAARQARRRDQPAPSGESLGC